MNKEDEEYIKDFISEIASEQFYINKIVDINSCTKCVELTIKSNVSTDIFIRVFNQKFDVKKPCILYFVLNTFESLSEQPMYSYYWFNKKRILSQIIQHEFEAETIEFIVKINTFTDKNGCELYNPILKELFNKKNCSEEIKTKIMTFFVLDS